LLFCDAKGIFLKEDEFPITEGRQILCHIERGNVIPGNFSKSPGKIAQSPLCPVSYEPAAPFNGQLNAGLFEKLLFLVITG